MPKPLKKILKSTLHFKVNGSLWIECDGKKYFGPGPMELLELIDKTGSINKSAMQMDMSYKKALEIIKRLNSYAESPLIETQAGGEKGGGSVISAEAKLLMDNYQKLRSQFQDFLEKQTSQLT